VGGWFKGCGGFVAPGAVESVSGSEGGRGTSRIRRELSEVEVSMSLQVGLTVCTAIACTAIICTACTAIICTACTAIACVLVLLWHVLHVLLVVSCASHNACT
jgi:hypothetical protein